MSAATIEAAVADLLRLPTVPAGIEEVRAVVRRLSDADLAAAIERGLAAEPLAERMRRRPEPVVEPEPEPEPREPVEIRVPEEWRRPEAVVVEHVGPTTTAQAEMVGVVGLAAVGEPGVVYRSRWVVHAPRSCVAAVAAALRALAAGNATPADEFVRARYER